ncbi:hypothetical protein CWB96_07925 [Pseudoalteromonas citrea]|uniref:Uncharacterized protein n=2 Tax=Pseudoalteromonas TaxID=53246 RepID=A0A5S3XR39_9GAMM|nr:MULTISPECIES: hypothetical protein [Pseudoalteromonas]TMO60477.1 hypothetical protein CWC18_13775 [Pseudoalteromonas aurantia]TMO79046.1 hypothetical protein CWC20_00045 [Pseudoalteromonas aurantia]TMP38802.1 hypothetical protein CWB97_21480 [Pseudoalteromonas citrea]TMP60132.1 hypothetical protein CWB96_07925 [Pseudoalteromonas citrea]
MKKELTFLTNKAEVEFKFNKEGKCSKLVYFYKSASSFEAVQINTLLSSHVFSLKIDGVEQYDFVEQKSDYNYYILFSPFIVPLFMAIDSTVNWSRGRWRK